MKYIYPLLPALFPVVFAASIQRDISSEDKLRDHLAMFRQVFNGDGQLLSPPEPPPATELRDEHNPRAETLKKLLAEMNLSDQLPNETSRRVPAVKSSPYNTYMEDQFGNENSDHENTPEGQFEILPFLPSDRTFPGSSVINKDHSSDANSAKDDLIKTTDDSFDSTVDTPDIPENSPAVSDDTSDLAEDSSRIFDDSLNTSLDLRQGPEIRHNNTINTTFLIPHANLHKNNTATADNTKDITQPEELSENDEDFEDERIPSLLADGLRSLLGNQSDYSATFEIPDLESEPQPSKVNSTQSPRWN
ncbi:hypothetical protein JCM33374_g1750 [Metschnikowia sp. JCM 33374]|nr:hypothetical protein JCM33374_g1750 [Metschnikowia sp. JCM 33374]